MISSTYYLHSDQIFALPSTKPDTSYTNHFCISVLPFFRCHIRVITRVNGEETTSSRYLRVADIGSLDDGAKALAAAAIVQRRAVRSIF